MLAPHTIKRIRSIEVAVTIVDGISRHDPLFIACLVEEEELLDMVGWRHSWELRRRGVAGATAGRQALPPTLWRKPFQLNHPKVFILMTLHVATGITDSRRVARFSSCESGGALGHLVLLNFL